MSKSHLELTNVQMAFDTKDGPFVALENVDLKIRKGEFVSLIGHSGCGKSTVLNIVAGLLQATRGGCVLDGHEVNTPGPERAVVFQNHSLMPWLTVYENVELAVQQVFRKSMSRAERKEWILHNLKLVNMDHALDKRPGEISGGMAQRVGIARALSMKPSVLLMDEPFGALDALTHQYDRAWREIASDVLHRGVMPANGALSALPIVYVDGGCACEVWDYRGGAANAVADVRTVRLRATSATIARDAEIEANAMEALEDEDAATMRRLRLEGALLAATKPALRLESPSREDAS